MPTIYVNTNSTAGGNGSTNATTGDNRAFATLAAAVAALPGEISSDTIIKCAGSAVDTTSVTIVGNTFSGGARLTIEDDNPSAVWDTGRYRLQAADYVIDVRIPAVTLRGLQLATTSASTSQYACVMLGNDLTSGADVRVEQCYLRNLDATTGKRYGVWLEAVGGEYHVNNCIMDGFDGHSNSAGVRHITNGLAAWIHHNTIVNCNAGYYTSVHTPGNIVLQNNIFQNCTDTIVNTSGTGFNAASDYNITDDDGSSLPGSNNTVSTTITFAGSLDYSHTDADALVANNLYSDTDSPVTIDIAGTARPSTGSVYAGAYQVPSSSVDVGVSFGLAAIATGTATAAIEDGINADMASDVAQTTMAAANPAASLLTQIVAAYQASGAVNESISIDAIMPMAFAATIAAQVSASLALVRGISVVSDASVDDGVIVNFAVLVDGSASTDVTETIDVSLSIAALQQIACSAMALSQAQALLTLTSAIAGAGATSIIASASLATQLGKTAAAVAVVDDDINNAIEFALTMDSGRVVNVNVSLSSAVAGALSADVVANGDITLVHQLSMLTVANALLAAGIPLTLISSVTYSLDGAEIVVELPLGRTLTVTLDARELKTKLEDRRLEVQAENRMKLM